MPLEIRSRLPFPSLPKARWLQIGACALLAAGWLGLFPSYGCTAVLLVAVAGWFVVTWQRDRAPALAAGH